MRIILSIFCALSFYTQTLSSEKEIIIKKLKLTDSLSFNFIQTIGGKNENGNCIIKYPKKIYCEYDDINKKILVSNGRSLVIKNTKTSAYYRYPLKKTPLELLLDKDYLLSKINILEPRNIDNKYLNFKLIQNKNEINIFFDINTFNLIGWQTLDIYQNLSITYLSSIIKNKEIKNDLFKLPIQD